MKNSNLAEWALNHKEFVIFFILVTMIMGIFSYYRLGRMEDPDFVIRQMLVTVAWPGATAHQIEEQVTDKIEKKLQDTIGLDYLKSLSRPGKSIIYVVLKDTVPESQVRPTWLEVRNMVNDIKDSLPSGVVGPYYNDRFDDVYGNIFAITSDGYSYEEMRETAERIRRILIQVANVKKIALIGVQPEKIFVEIESNKLSQLGIDPNYIAATLQAQNAMTPSGKIDTSTDDVYLRVSGMFENIDSIRNLPIRANGRTFRLADIAAIRRGYADPPEPKMFFNGQPAIGIAVSMEKGGNILQLGYDLDTSIAQIKNDLPLGLEIHQVANQPKTVDQSISEFVKSLLEAILIVLAISFISLGLRTGFVVALCIPLVIAGVFVCMDMFGIDLQKISLGALIIALGLLVDDAILVVEMMAVKLEQGWDRFHSASAAYKITAFPMLTGTLITCAGFIPVGFSKGSASEFVGSIFDVVTIALLLSWLVASTATPLLAYYLVKVKDTANVINHDIYDTKFYIWFKQILVWCLDHRKLVLSATLVCFVGSVILLQFVKKEFFPPSTRPELIIDLRLPEGASIQATEQISQEISRQLEGNKNIEHFSYYVGESAPRFVLTADPILPSSNFAQFVIIAKDIHSRSKLNHEIKNLLNEKFPNVRSNIKLILTGPPDPYPVTLRVSGSNQEKVRSIAEQVRKMLSANPMIREISFDWYEKSKTLQLEVDQDKARMLGISSQSLAFDLQTKLSGASVAQFREKDKTVDIVLRIDAKNRDSLAAIKNLNIHIGNGKFVSLDQIAKIKYSAENGLIWRRNLKPTITVQATTIPGITGNDATQQAFDSLKSLRDNLPTGYSIEIGGALERSAQAADYLFKPVPAMIILIIVLLMIQLQSIAKMILTLLTAPLGIIGVSIALLLTQKPMGFVVELGILALAGIIIRNTVILTDQITQQQAAGETVWQAIINATVLRFRPIMLTAAAAILAMIPLATSLFWGPMAVAIAGGLFIATILTLLVFPTMYAAWFRVHPDTAIHETPSTSDSHSQPVLPKS